MSDMEQSDVADVLPSQRPVEGLQPADAPALDVPPDPEPTPEPEATPIIARTPSSESPTQQPEASVDADEEAPSLEDAVRTLIPFIRSHRTPGDSDLDAALSAVEAALPAQDA